MAVVFSAYGVAHLANSLPEPLLPNESESPNNSNAVGTVFGGTAKTMSPHA